MTLDQLVVLNVVAFSALAFLLKAFVNHRLTKDVEAHKVALSLEAREFEKRLEIAAAARQTTFTALHEKRAAVLADLYSKAHEAVHQLRMFVKIEYREFNTRQQYDSAESAVLDLGEFVDANRLYLPKAVADDLDSLVTKCASGIIEFDRKSRTRGTVENDKSFFLCQGELKQLVDNEASDIMRRIEDDFRRMLGVFDDPRSIDA